MHMSILPSYFNKVAYLFYIHLLFALETTHNLYYLILLVNIGEVPHSLISSVSQLTCLPSEEATWKA
jgi:hypothetical protein